MQLENLFGYQKQFLLEIRKLQLENKMAPLRSLALPDCKIGAWCIWSLPNQNFPNFLFTGMALVRE